MSKTTDRFALRDLAQELAAVLANENPPGVRRRTSAIATSVGFSATNRTLPTALTPLLPALEPLPCRFSDKELVELLKNPLCVGPARRVILDQLEIRHRQKFADQWDYVRFATQHKLDVDFSSPWQRR